MITIYIVRVNLIERKKGYPIRRAGKSIKTIPK